MLGEKQTPRLANERLWAEALNLSGYDLLAKRFDRTEPLRVGGAAGGSLGGHAGL